MPRLCVRCHQECECYHYNLCPIHRAMVPEMCECLDPKKAKKEELPEELKPPPLVRQVGTYRESPPAPPPTPEPVAVRPPPLAVVDDDLNDPVSLVSIVSEGYENSLNEMRSQARERARQQDEFMERMKNQYILKMKELEEQKQKMDEMLKEKEREIEIAERIRKNEQKIKEIRQAQKQNEKSAVFSRLSMGKSSVGEGFSLLKNSLKRSS